MAKLTEKEVLDILGIKTAGMPEEQKNFVLNLSGAFTEAINKSIEGTIDTKGLQDALAPLNEQKLTLDALSKENQQLVDQVKNLSEALEKMKKKRSRARSRQKFLQHRFGLNSTNQSRNNLLTP